MILPRLFCGIGLSAFAALVTLPVRAELILDDFDDPAEVVEISRGSTSVPAITEDVGELAAARGLTIFASRTDPAASFDSGVSSLSVLSVMLDGHAPSPPVGQTVISYTAKYDFSPRDLTQSGANNAFLFDFLSHEGTQLPTFFRVVARAPSAAVSYVALPSDFFLSSEAYTAVIPFRNFTVRGGAPATPNFSTLTELFINFYFLRPSEDIHWSAQLDRIRIGSIPVPEPSSIWLGMAGIAVLGWRRQLIYCRRIERCGNEQLFASS